MKELGEHLTGERNSQDWVKDRDKRVAYSTCSGSIQDPHRYSNLASLNFAVSIKIFRVL